MEDSDFIKFFADNQFIRIVDTLIDNINEDFNKKEIQELAELGKGAFFIHWPKAEELGLVKVTKTVSRAYQALHTQYGEHSCKGHA